MLDFWSLTSIFRIVATSCFIASGVGGFSTYAQQPSPNLSPSAGAQERSQSDQMGMTDEEEEVAHPFFTHLGVPEAEGLFDLRLAALATRADGRTKGDLAFHFETGLTKYIGLHVRNDSFLDRTRFGAGLRN